MLVYYLSLVNSPEDKSWVETIYHRYKNLIKRLALSRMKDEELAEEVLHEVMLAVIESIEKLQDRDENGIKGFIYLATRNICINMLRKKFRRKEVPFEEPPFSLGDDGDPQQGLNHAHLLDCIADLPSLYRDVLELTACFGLSVKECAKALEISPAAAQKRLERARILFRKKLKEEELDV